MLRSLDHFLYKIGELELYKIGSPWYTWNKQGDMLSCFGHLEFAFGKIEKMPYCDMLCNGQGGCFGHFEKPSGQIYVHISVNFFLHLQTCLCKYISWPSQSTPSKLPPNRNKGLIRPCWGTMVAKNCLVLMGVVWRAMKYSWLNSIKVTQHHTSAIVEYPHKNQGIIHWKMYTDILGAYTYIHIRTESMCTDVVLWGVPYIFTDVN